MTKLKEKIITTLKKEPLEIEVVLNACEHLLINMENGIYEALLSRVMGEYYSSKNLVDSMRSLFQKEQLKKRVAKELIGIRQYYPLGVLFHIGAGNQQGIGAYSVLEGLLSGNINLVKVASTGDELSLFLLNELTKLEPKLKEYIYIISFPSSDKRKLSQCIHLADGIIVWGGMSVIQTIRAMVPPNKKIFEWGHKISFAFVTSKGRTKEQLEGLASHIIETNRVLCSSCQEIYLDTEDMLEVERFARELLGYLEEGMKNRKLMNQGAIAHNTILMLGNQYILQAEKKIVKGRGCSVVISKEKTMESTVSYGACQIKGIPKESLVDVTYPYRGFLQTVGLLCGQEEEKELSELLLRAGVTRITSGRRMSELAWEEAHDGIEPLRQYVRICSTK